MSLVNDLLIETERRRSASGRRRGTDAPVDDLVPIRPGRRESRAFERSLLALAVAGTIGGLVALVPYAPFSPSAPFAPFAPFSKLGRNLRSAEADRATPPPVAARRVESKSDATQPAVKQTTSQRPVQIESIAIDRRPDATQLRIVCDGRTGHRLERDDAEGHVELVIAGAALVEATEPLDLLGTPIRSLDVRSEAPDLHLVLALDPGVRAQSRWLDVPGGAALVLDLQSPTPRASADVSADASAEAPAHALAEAPLDAVAAEEWPIVEAPVVAAADRVISPALGDPAALRIERSERDRVRQERAATRAAIADALAAARRARTEGRLEDADDRYAEVALLAPEDWAAICEWAELLVARKRPDDALALVKRARQSSPRHPGLLMTEARLLERKGDLAGAIALLDGAGLALTESPDVHTLAAAYHQRAGDHAAAIERYEQLLRRFPEESRSWMGLGISLEAVGRREEARDVYRISLQVGELPRATRRWVGARLVALGEGD